MADPKSHPVDIHVGGRVRARRHILGQSQTQLADALGMTFQQVQKYERGINRVSASKLWEIARAQGAPMAYYFEGLADPEHNLDLEPSPISLFATLPHAAELAENYVELSTDSRRAVLGVARALCDLLPTRARPIDDVDHGAAPAFN